MLETSRHVGQAVELVPLGQNAVVVRGVVVPGAVVVVSNVVSVLIVGAVRTSQSLSVDVLQDVFVGLRLVRLVIF